MGKSVYISRPEDEATTELKRIRPQFLLMMSTGPCTLSCCGVVLAKKVQKVGRFQLRSVIGLAPFVDEKRKGDACFFAKQPRVIAVAQTNRGQYGSLVSKRLLVLAQLRDVLTAKNSAVVPEEYQDSGMRGP